MFIPRVHDLQSRSDILEVLRRSSFGHLVTSRSTGDQPAIVATPLPFVVDDAISHVCAHIARANDQWIDLDGSDALLIVPGVDTYVSPRWYPSKVAHGKVVPTWNYEVIHLRGVVQIHDDSSWKLEHVNELTRHNERSASNAVTDEIWEVSDAPDDFIAKQLTAIVGIEIAITGIEAVRKLSQNKSGADLAGVIDGLSNSELLRDNETAVAMRPH